MNIETRQIVVSGITVQVFRKAIKNLHLGVYPPNGRVRVAAPLRVSDNAVRLAVVGKLGWIRRQRAKFEAQPRQSAREMVSGESHYYFGRRYRLRVIPATTPAKVVLRGSRTMELHAKHAATRNGRLTIALTPSPTTIVIPESVQRPPITNNPAFQPPNTNANTYRI